MVGPLSGVDLVNALGPLRDEDLNRFVTDGYLRLSGVVPDEVVNRCREWLWQAMKLDPDDPTSWRDPVVRVFGSTAKPFMDAMNRPILCAALDQVVGSGNWQRPIVGTGTFPVRFPSEEDPGDAGWHIEGSYSVDGRLFVNVASRDRALLMLILFSDVGKSDAPTRIRRGSHLLVPKALLAAGEAGLPFEEVVPRVAGVDSLPVDLATGEAGDVFLCHPFLVHAANWPHRGTVPRFMSQAGLVPSKPLDLGASTGWHSPVERAIRIGLGEEQAE
ncbi:MAG: phytanoyl-CoA dioxygenase family protein [bacterium]|nr:phytanoyl-CoA dioxygenase family protein [bacterium]